MELPEIPREEAEGELMELPEIPTEEAEGELMELPEIPWEEAEERVGNKAEDPGTTEADTGPHLEIPMIPEDPEVVSVREGIQERIQAEIEHVDKGGGAGRRDVICSSGLE